MSRLFVIKTISVVILFLFLGCVLPSAATAWAITIPETTVAGMNATRENTVPVVDGSYTPEPATPSLTGKGQIMNEAVFTSKSSKTSRLVVNTTLVNTKQFSNNSVMKEISETTTGPTVNATPTPPKISADDSIPAVSASLTGVSTHPALLFNSINEVPGYLFNKTQPWSTYQTLILNGANESLKLNFTENLRSHNRPIYRAIFARELALTYQITKKPAYAIKAREALLNLQAGTVQEGYLPPKADRAIALGSYALAYDMIQPTLDNRTDNIIRDKLATLADTVYQELNDKGTTRDRVYFADYHGQAYPNVGIAGAALEDYTNPNRLPLSSTPADWRKVGTDYLFVDDKLHSYGRSLFSFGFDEVSGKHLSGAYKSYVTTDFIWWLQVYDHYYHDNPFARYPAAQKAFTAELWDSLPNEYSSNYVTDGTLKYTYHRVIANLLSITDQSNALNHDDLLDNSTILPYSHDAGDIPSSQLYCFYGNYNGLPRTYPAATSRLNADAIFQVFRSGWGPEADWLSMVTWNYNTTSNRDMAHNDQASIEYYSHGNLLLADAGENKFVLDKLYGFYEIHHNTIAIEDPRKPFSTSSWAGSPARGIFKGNSNGIGTPAEVRVVLQAPWIQLEDVRMTITRVLGSFGRSQNLSTPIQYTREILYPDSDYFIVIDRLEGNQTWIYDTIFRFASLVTTPTKASGTGSNVSYMVGNVDGILVINNKTYEWLALPYKIERTTGVSTNSLMWITMNPYGKQVELKVFSVPSSEIRVTKSVGRIGGSNYPSEVYSPVVRYRTQPAIDLFRVTVLLSRNIAEANKIASALKVNGTGNALSVDTEQYHDYIYTGEGISTFGQFTTDAKTAYIRKSGSAQKITMIDGSFLKYGNQSWVSLSRKAGYISVNNSNGLVDYRIDNKTEQIIKIFSITY